MANFMADINTQTPINIGFMPLSDCAPLVVAQTLGLFAAEGLQVNLLRQNSWATLRDKLQAGLLDAAQMLAPMPLACHMGYGSNATPMRAPFVLSYHGNAITLSETLFAELCSEHQWCTSDILSQGMSAKVLTPLIQKRRCQGIAKLRFATVFPFSCHYYQLASWLASANISLDEVDISIIPPSGMVKAMQEGMIDGFCVGAPWNAAAVRTDIGVTVITTDEIWHGNPEKVLGLTQQWQQDNPDTLAALIRALDAACRWLTPMPNRFEAARWLATSDCIDAGLDVVAPALIGSCLTKSEVAPRRVDQHTLFQAPDSSNAPSPEQGQWLLQQMSKCQHIQRDHDFADIASTVFAPEAYEAALK